jgi:hypothetical protein
MLRALNKVNIVFSIKNIFLFLGNIIIQMETFEIRRVIRNKKFYNIQVMVSSESLQLNLILFIETIKSLILSS